MTVDTQDYVLIFFLVYNKTDKVLPLKTNSEVSNFL